MERSPTRCLTAEGIPDRYMVFGDKADLAWLKALKLRELDAIYVDCEDDEDKPLCLTASPMSAFFPTSVGGPCGGGGGL